MTSGYDVIWSWAAKSKAWDAATSSASRTASTKENRRKPTSTSVALPPIASSLQPFLCNPRSSRREEAHFSNAECGVRNAELSQSLLTSAATALGFKARTDRLRPDWITDRSALTDTAGAIPPWAQAV